MTRFRIHRVEHHRKTHATRSVSIKNEKGYETSDYICTLDFNIYQTNWVPKTHQNYRRNKFIYHEDVLDGMVLCRKWSVHEHVAYHINDFDAYPYFLQAFIYHQKRWRERQLIKKLIIKKRIFTALKMFPTVLEDLILQYFY